MSFPPVNVYLCEIQKICESCHGEKVVDGESCANCLGTGSTWRRDSPLGIARAHMNVAETYFAGVDKMPDQRVSVLAEAELHMRIAGYYLSLSIAEQQLRAVEAQERAAAAQERTASLLPQLLKALYAKHEYSGKTLSVAELLAQIGSTLHE